MSDQPTIQFPKPLRVNLHRDMTPPRVKIECGDIVVADCIGESNHAERIAACVNACVGIADPHAAIQVMRELRDALSLQQELSDVGLIGASHKLLRAVDESRKQALTKAKEVLG